MFKFKTTNDTGTNGNVGKHFIVTDEENLP